MIYEALLTNAGYLFLIINTLVFTISYNVKNKEQKYFIMYLILCFTVQMFSGFLSDLRQNNLFLSHYFFIGQFIFLSLFFSTFYRFKNIIRSFTFLVALSFIFYLNLNTEIYKKWSVIEIAVTSIPLIIYSLLFFVKKISDNKDNKYIYFNTGFFLYTLCSTLIFSLGNIGTRELKFYVWKINNLLYFIFQVLIFIEWYKNFRKSLTLKNNLIDTKTK